MFKPFQTSTTCAALALLSACGGSSESTTAPVIPPPAVPVCAPGYVTRDINTGSGGQSFSMLLDEAEFAFTVPAASDILSVRVCLGKPATAFTKAGVTAMSPVFDLRVYPRNWESAGVQNLSPRSLKLSFTNAALPSGTPNSSMVFRTKMYGQIASNVWQQLDSTGTNGAASGLQVNTAAGTGAFTISPNSDGYYAVGYID